MFYSFNVYFFIYAYNQFVFISNKLVTFVWKENQWNLFRINNRVMFGGWGENQWARFIPINSLSDLILNCRELTKKPSKLRRQGLSLWAANKTQWLDIRVFCSLSWSFFLMEIIIICRKYNHRNSKINKKISQSCNFC